MYMALNHQLCFVLGDIFMGNDKQVLVQSLKNRLATMVDSETASNIIDVLIYELKDYDLTKKTTEIVPYDDENQRIIKSFLGCLIVEGKSKSTVAQYKYSLNRLFKFLGNRKYTEITTADVMAWLASLKLSGAKSSSVRNQRSNISPFFTWLYANSMIERNPLNTIKPIKVPDEEKKAFSNDEVDTIRNICTNPYERALVETLLASGLRVNELANLKVEDVDFEKLVIHVKNGKGGKDRTTFITSVTKKYIFRYLKWNKHKSDYVFTSRLDGKYSTNGLGDVMRKMSKRCDIHIHPHRFRRTLATELARRGMPIQEIQKLLGHSKISTTQGYIETNIQKVEASYRQFAI